MSSPTIGDERQDGIAQGMLEKHRALAQPLGVRRADVVHAKHFQDAGAQVTRVACGLDGHQAEDRQDHDAAPIAPGP